MELLSVYLIEKVIDKSTEILIDKTTLMGELSDYFTLHNNQKAIFEKCLDERFFFYVMNLANINEVFFLRYKMLSDFAAFGAKWEDAKAVVDSLVILAEYVKDTHILDGFNESLTEVYEELSGAIRNYDRGLYKQAASAIAQLSSKGVDVAHYYLGKCFYEGKALKKDISKAVQCFTKGFLASSSDATYYLSMCFLRGDGVARNAEKGLELLKKAADLGQKDAVYAVGNMYKDGGSGFQMDIKRAIDFLQKAADYGNWSAAISVCELYFEDAKVTGNFHRTSVARKRIQDVSDPETCLKIAQIYERGIGIPPNIEKALNFSAKAAAKNYPGANEMMTRLGNKKLGRV